MKNYTTYTLKQLDSAKNTLSKKLLHITIQSKRYDTTPNYDPILNDLKIIDEIIKKRTGSPVRCSLPLKQQKLWKMCDG